MIRPFFALLAVAAIAGADDQENYDKKLKEPFLKNAPWVIDYDQARADAKKSGLPIFAYFTRSYSP